MAQEKDELDIVYSYGAVKLGLIREMDFYKQFVTWGVQQMVNDAFTPLLIQSIMESEDVEDSANVLAVLMAEALGVNVQTYPDKRQEKSNKRDKL